VGLVPGSDRFWTTLGVAQYRTGNWKEAVTALDKAHQLRRGGSPTGSFFRAMAHARLGDADLARTHYEQALRLLKMSGEAPAGDRSGADTLARFRAEAEEVLGLGPVKK
jgi:Flp pilus assembly protein TadD